MSLPTLEPIATEEPVLKKPKPKGLKFKADSRSIQEAISMASLACPLRSPMDSLLSLKIVAKEDRVFVIGTDIEISICVPVNGAEVIEDGELLLPKRYAHGISRGCNGEVKAWETKGRVHFVCGKDRHSAMTGDPAKSPAHILEFAHEEYFIVRGDRLRRGVMRALIGASDFDTKYTMTGVCLDMEPDSIGYCVATDGRRMSMCPIHGTTVGDHRTLAEGTIIPSRSAKAIRDVLSMLPNDRKEKDVLIHAGPSYLDMCGDGFWLRTSLLSGRFPKWRNGIPSEKEGYSIVSFTAGEMTEALRKISFMVTKETLGGEFTFEAGEVCIRMDPSSDGESLVSFPISGMFRPGSVRLQVDLFKDWLRSLHKEEPVMMEFPADDGDMRQVILSLDDGSVYIMAPMARIESQRNGAAIPSR